ncbi:alanyl-tRNA editing protein [Tepidamorphus sp. 3E244]|uniref:alanyl-tRNA editing protein n=1 Tax=Tepidamorphus sp. 3E244 TaxID=3385498 RepID=UPI0038FC198C
MSDPAEPLFSRNAYARSFDARVVAINERGGILLDDTAFYATSGGQPGDTGSLTLDDGRQIIIAKTVKGEVPGEIVHVPADGADLPRVGDSVRGEIDWARRHNLMKMHTACHLLSVACPFPITGASVGETESRVDFDMPGDPPLKDDLNAALAEMIAGSHPVTTNWISEADLEANPGLVKSKNVRPPRGAGRIRLVLIGEDGVVDSQPCGGTHVADTSEIGTLIVKKIEKKGRENRRIRIALA